MSSTKTWPNCLSPQLRTSSFRLRVLAEARVQYRLMPKKIRCELSIHSKECLHLPPEIHQALVTLIFAKAREVKLRVADKPLQTFKQRIRQLTRRSGGCSMTAVVQNLRPYMLGWKAYFGLSQTPKAWRDLDEWLRHRLRAIQLKQWKRGKTIFRELRALGASVDVAAQVAGNARRWWHNSAMLLPIAYFDRLGLPRLS